MSRIVKEQYPIEKLPEDLRVGLPKGARVRVTLDWDAPVEPRMTLDEILSAVPDDRRRSAEEIDEGLRHERDRWER